MRGRDNVDDAFRQVKEIRPDVVLVDISLKDSHGIELISQVKAFDERIKMLVWSMFDEKIYAERAIRAGAMGYISKQEPIENVIEAMRHVLQGNMYLSPHMTNNVLRRLGGGEARFRPDRRPFQSGNRGLPNARPGHDHESDRQKAGRQPENHRSPPRTHQDQTEPPKRLRTELPGRAMGAGKRLTAVDENSRKLPLNGARASRPLISLQSTPRIDASRRA